MNKPQKRILSGIQTTSSMLHLGNYVGALQNWVSLQEECEVFGFLADWHSLTTMSEDTSAIQSNARNLTRECLAAGIDPKRSAIFIQSHVKEHAELHLLFSMITPLGWLERSHAYKEKKQRFHHEREAYGLLGYPVLQAADILLYKPYGVPVGRDQAQHLEIAHDIARRFNRIYGPVFPDFKNLLSDVPLLLGLDGKKMSKSYGNTIHLIDSEEATTKKMMTAYTDPLKIHKNDPGHPEGCTIFSIHSAFNKANVLIVDKECRAGDRGCVQCKKECISAVNTTLRPIRERYQSIDPGSVESILKEGAEKARTVASETIKEVRTAMKFD